ncbi:MAG TPA: hypothetical protein PLI51_12115, partial [bacterium]|nr:hypothetical protein [bacterium]
LYLYFSYFFVVVAARLTTNLVIYPYTQFRYQFVPNALAVMAGIVLVCGLFRPRRREKAVIALAAVPLIAANAYLSWTYSGVISDQLAPLGNLLKNVKTHLDDGRINPSARLYIDPAVTEKLPQLCWNRTMAKLGMIQGTYQWIFSGEELASFTDRPENAVWTIGPADPVRIRRIAGRLTATPPPDAGEEER